MSTPISPKLRPPKLGDSGRFVRVDRVPIIDVHRRRLRKKDPATGEDIIVEEEVDPSQLRKICRNSRERSHRGEYGLVFLGHTDDDGPEIRQPPIVGYMSNYQVGEHNGRPTILADIFIDRKESSDPDRTLRQFPRRSAEVIGINNEDGFIDSVALIKRAPERELGLVTSQYRTKRKVYRYMCPSCEEEAEEETMGLSDHNQKALKGALNVIEHIVGGILDSGEPSGMDDDLGGPSEHFDEPSDGDPSFSMEDEPSYDESSSSSEPSLPSPSEPSDSSFSPSEPSDNLGFREPSRMRRHDRHVSRHRRHDPSEPSEPSEPSGPSEPSRPMRRRSSTMSSPSEPSNPSGPSGDPSRLDPSRPIKGVSRRSAAAASAPSPTNVSPPSHSGHNRKINKSKSINIPPGDFRKTSRHSSGRDVDRMRREERLTVSRNGNEQATIERYERRLAVLEAERKEERKKAHKAECERRVIQLQSEGYVLDRAATVARFSRLPSDQLDGEMDYLRSVARQSPVNQGLIPPQMFADLGGNSTERPPSPASRPSDESPSDIFGSSVARYAAQHADKLDRLKPIDRAMAAVVGFRGRSSNN